MCIVQQQEINLLSLRKHVRLCEKFQATIVCPLDGVITRVKAMMGLSPDTSVCSATTVSIKFICVLRRWDDLFVANLRVLLTSPEYS